MRNTRTLVVAALIATLLAGCGSEENGPVGPSPGSSNPLLSGLTTSEGPLTPGFVATHATYTIWVPNDTSSLSVTARSSTAKSSISMEGPGLPAEGVPLAPGVPSPTIELAVGDNVIVLESVSEDGSSTMVYAITATRALR